MTSTHAVTVGELQTSSRWAVAGLSLSMLLASLGTSIANVGLPAIGTAFGASFQDVQWIVLAYLLAITTLVVGAGRLGDMIGRRRLLLSGLLVFTAASSLCGIAPELWVLITARAVQGAGAAVMLALTMTFVGELPKARAGSAMGLLGTMSAIGTALGPSLGGLLISGFGWRATFLVTVPLGLLTFTLALRHLPVDPSTRKEGALHFDGAGTLLLALTLATYGLAMTLGHGSFGALNVALVLAALFATGLFVLIEMRALSPLVQLSMFRDPTLSASLATNALVSTVMMATLVVGPFFLSRALELDPAGVGAAISVGPIISGLTGVVAGRVVDRFGPSPMMLVGLIEIGAGAVALALLPTLVGLPGYIIAIVILTPGYQLFQAANNTAVMTGADVNQRGVVSGMLNLSRNLGLITGASVMGTVFAAASGSIDVVTAPSDLVGTGMRTTFAVAGGLILVAIGITVRSRAVGARPFSHR